MGAKGACNLVISQERRHPARMAAPIPESDQGRAFLRALETAVPDAAQRI